MQFHLTESLNSSNIKTRGKKADSPFEIKSRKTVLVLVGNKTITRATVTGAVDAGVLLLQPDIYIRSCALFSAFSNYKVNKFLKQLLCFVIAVLC